MAVSYIGKSGGHFMNMKKLSIRTLTALSLFGSMLGSQSFAQENRNVQPKLGVLPCCNCLNEVKTTTVNTGSVAWTVQGPSAASPVAAVNSSNPAWGTTIIPSAAWISPTGNPGAAGNYVYRTTIDTRNCTLNSTVTISGKFLADNVGSVLVDGRPIVSSAGTPNYGFLPGSLTNFSYTVPTGGVHTVTINAYNAGGPTGMIAEVTATRNCRGNLEKDREAELSGPKATVLASAVPVSAAVPCSTC
jgi:hypothetical protein